MRSELPKIAFATTVYDQAHVGGGTFVHYLRKAVEHGRLDIVFYSDDIEQESAPYERKIVIPRRARILRLGWLQKAFYFNRAILSDINISTFDLVWHNNVLTTLLASRPYGCPSVGMINDYNYIESNTPFATARKFGLSSSVRRFMWRQIEEHTAIHADAIVVNSEYMRSAVKREYLLSDDKIELLYKAVDLESFRFKRDRDFCTPVRILFVKNDYVRGGLFDLLRAMSSISHDVVLSVVGPPTDSHTSIMNVAAQLGVRDLIDIRGPISRDEMPGLFWSHDILCVPSRSEALGVVFMEALAAGIPAVGTNVGGIPEVLDHGRAGWLAHSQNPTSLREKLLQVIEHRADREARVRYGRAYVTKFSQDRMINDVLRIADDVARRGSTN